MIKMQLLESNIIRAILYGIGFLWAIYVLYDIKPSRKTLVDLFLSIGIYFVMNISNYFFTIKEMVFLIVAFLIISIRHKIPVYSSFMFSTVTLFMLVFTYPLAILSLTVNRNLIVAIIMQTNDLNGYLAIIVPSLVFIILYVSSSYIVKRTLDLRNDRLKSIYYISSFANMCFILVLSFLLNYIVNDFGAGLQLLDKYSLMGFSFIGLLLLPFIQLFNIQVFINLNQKQEKSEDELLALNDSRILAYRYSHNMNNILLTLNQMSKTSDRESIIRYLEKFEISDLK